MDLTRLYDRDDAARWAHPEIVSIYEEMSHQEDVLGVMFNPDVPAKEKQEKAKTIFGNLDPAYTEEQQARTQVVEVPGCVEEPDAPAVKAWLVSPKKPKRKMPCIINIGGGGLFCCSTAPNAATLADTFNCVGVEFAYRTLPFGDRYPAQLNDCHAVYSYILEHAEELHVNPRKIVVMGMSSGGHLVLSLCHRLKRHGIRPRGCVAIVPALEDRVIFPSGRFVSTGWASEQSAAMYRDYLGEIMGTDAVTPEMAPNRATVEDCVGLPPTILHAHANDIYTDPCMDYCSKLNQAGVYSGLHVWPGSNHDAIFTVANTFRNDPEYPYANAYANVIDHDIADLIEYDFSRPWVAEVIGE